MNIKDLYPALPSPNAQQSRLARTLSSEELMRRANHLADENKFEESLIFYDLALDGDPDAPAIWYNAGKTFSDMERYEEAIRCYDHAIVWAPFFGSAWKNKGSALAKSNRLQEAIVCFDKALELNPDDTGAREGRNIAQSMLEMEALRRGQQTTLPQNATPKQYLEVLRYASARIRDQQDRITPQVPPGVQNLLPHLSKLGYDLSKLGCDPWKFANAQLHGDWARKLLDLLIKPLPAEVRELFDDESLFAIGELPVGSINAETIRAPNGGWVILFREGLLVFIYKLARILCTRLVVADSEEHVPNGEEACNFDTTCIRAKELFTNYASAGVPVCADFPITPPQMMMANHSCPN